jgi:hypothetical protein
MIDRVLSRIRYSEEDVYSVIDKYLKYCEYISEQISGFDKSLDLIKLIESNIENIKHARNFNFRPNSYVPNIYEFMKKVVSYACKVADICGDPDVIRRIINKGEELLVTEVKR